MSMKSGGKKQQVNLQRINILANKYSDSIFCIFRVWGWTLENSKLFQKCFQKYQSLIKVVSFNTIEFGNSSSV